MNALNEPPARLAPSPNGSNVTSGTPGGAAHTEMLDRVQQLRLDGQLGGAKAARPPGAAWLPWVLAAVMALAWAGVGVRSYKNLSTDGLFTSAAPAAGVGGSGSAGANSAAQPAAPVPEAGSVTLEVKGYVMSAVSVAVSPIDVAGQVIELNFKEGQYFEAGAQLARIDPTNYQYAANEAAEFAKAAAERLNAAVKRRDELDPKSVRQIEKDQLTAQINESKAANARAEDELRRAESIRAGLSPKEYDTARNDAAAAKFRLEKLVIDLRLLEQGPRPEKIAAADADVAAARADVKTAEAKLAQAMWRLKNCVIRAPISGTITLKVAEKGVLINPLSNSAASGSGGFGTIADLSDMEVDLEIPERDIAKLAVGQACRIRADAFPGRPYAGKIDRIMPVANRAKSVVSIRVKVAIPPEERQGAYLKPEMGAVVTFLAGGPKS